MSDDTQYPKVHEASLKLIQDEIESRIQRYLHPDGRIVAGEELEVRAIRSLPLPELLALLVYVQDRCDVTADAEPTEEEQEQDDNAPLVDERDR